MTIISDIDSKLTTVISSEVASGAAAVSTVIKPLVGAAIMLYLLYIIYKSLFDQPNLLVMEVIKNIIALSVVTLFAFNTPHYISTVVPFVMGSGNDISAALIGGGAIAAIDTMNKTVWDAAWGIIDSVSFDIFDLDFSLALSSVAMFVMIVLLSIPFIVISAAYIFVAKLMTALLLIVGPIFISMAFFPATRDMFKSWTGQCFNYILLSILYSVSFAMISGAINALVFTGGVFDPTIENVAALAIVMIISYLIALQVPSLASGLAGGVGISGVGNGLMNLGIAGKLMSKATGTTAAGKALGGLAGKGIGKAYSAAKNKLSRKNNVEAA